MSVVRLALTVASAAVAISHNPVVRAAMNNPKAREAAVEATKTAAYNAGRIARLIVGPRAR